MSKKLTRLYLICLAENVCSLCGPRSCSCDRSLTEWGKHQSRQLEERLRGGEFCSVFCSPRRQAREACQIIGWSRAAKIEPDLAEWDYGHNDRCPGGESPAQVCVRADRLISRFQKMQDNVAVFSHGFFTEVIAARWIGKPVSQAQDMLFSTASLMVLGFERNQREQPIMIVWNAASYEMFETLLDPPHDAAGALNRQALERWENEGGEIITKENADTEDCGTLPAAVLHEQKGLQH